MIKIIPPTYNQLLLFCTSSPFKHVINIRRQLFWAILLTDRQTNTQQRKHYLVVGGNKAPSLSAVTAQAQPTFYRTDTLWQLTCVHSLCPRSTFCIDVLRLFPGCEMNALAIVFTPDRQRIFVSIPLNFLTFQSHFTTVGTFTDTSASAAEICFTHRRLFIPGPGNFTLLILWFHFVHESRTNRNSYTKRNPEAASTSCGKFQ